MKSLFLPDNMPPLQTIAKSWDLYGSRESSRVLLTPTIVEYRSVLSPKGAPLHSREAIKSASPSSSPRLPPSSWRATVKWLFGATRAPIKAVSDFAVVEGGIPAASFGLQRQSPLPSTTENRSSCSSIRCPLAVIDATALLRLLLPRRNASVDHNVISFARLACAQLASRLHNPSTAVRSGSHSPSHGD